MISGKFIITIIFSLHPSRYVNAAMGNLLLLTLGREGVRLSCSTSDGAVWAYTCGRASLRTPARGGTGDADPSSTHKLQTCRKCRWSWQTVTWKEG